MRDATATIPSEYSLRAPLVATPVWSWQPGLEVAQQEQIKMRNETQHKQKAAHQARFVENPTVILAGQRRHSWSR